MTWVLEREAFAHGDCLHEAALAGGHRVLAWQDEWWTTSEWPRLEGPVLFHGSLGNAARIARELPWRPGAYCAAAQFHCSAWYRDAAKWLLHQRWVILPASQLVRDVDAVMAQLGAKESIFVRPDSPLKPFAGRVLARDKVSLAALDHGFYYDDPDLHVVVAPVRQVVREWRYVVVAGEVIAGSAYLADGRTATPDDPQGRPWLFAAEVARDILPPEAVYVLDVCEAETGLHLLELNPFSGADLYACSGNDIVERVGAIARGAG